MALTWLHNICIIVNRSFSISIYIYTYMYIYISISIGTVRHIISLFHSYHSEQHSALHFVMPTVIPAFVEALATQNAVIYTLLCLLVAETHLVACVGEQSAIMCAAV